MSSSFSIFSQDHPSFRKRPELSPLSRTHALSVVADEISEASPDSPMASTTSMPSMGEDLGGEFRSLQSRECSKSLPETECNWALNDFLDAFVLANTGGEQRCQWAFSHLLFLYVAVIPWNPLLADTSLEVWRQALQSIE